MASTESIITARDKEIVELKAALEETENKYYNMGFNDVENFAKPVMFKKRKYGFGEGWLAAVMAMGVPEDSPLRNTNQIRYPKPSPPTTPKPTEAEDEDTPSMRELVQAINSHAELIDLEITSNPSVVPTIAQPQSTYPNIQPPVNLSPIQPDQPQNPTT